MKIITNCASWLMDIAHFTQMPVEGRKFNKVDRIWRNIMAKTVADPHVLQATSQPNMLANLNEANELLDAIMKGLNDYLEKKRLFFPRYD